MLRVAFDISRLYVNQTGIGSCIKNLQAAFEQLHNPDVEFVYVKPTYIQNRLYAFLPRFMAKLIEHAALNFWYQVHLPLKLRQLKCDILFSPDPASPVFAPCPSVITLYDMLVEIYPQYYGYIWRWLYHLFDQNALRRAERIICISETTRQDLEQILHVPDAKTEVVPIAADPVFQPILEQKITAVLERFDLSLKKYLLFVGGTNPRKNLSGMLEAFSKIALNWPELKLVIVGVNAGSKSGSKVEMDAHEEQPNTTWLPGYNLDQTLTNRLVTPGFVEQQELVALYGGAVALVFPSLYEGFGLPPLEAMACGCPVIVSSTGALPEVVGEASLLVDPTNPESIVVQLQLLLMDPTLQEQLRVAGLAQSKKFDWLCTASRTIEILQETAKIRRRS